MKTAIFVDANLYPEVRNITEKTIWYLNNNIKYGRNKWFVYMSILRTSDSNEIIRARQYPLVVSPPFVNLSPFVDFRFAPVFFQVCNQMSKGVLAIFGFTSSSVADTIKTYTSMHNIPFISLSHPVLKYRSHATELLQNDDSDMNDGGGSGNSQPSSSSASSSSYGGGGGGNSESNEIGEMMVSNEPIQENVNFQLSMHPDMVPLLISLIKYNRWKRIFYVYNHDEGMSVSSRIYT